MIERRFANVELRTDGPSGVITGYASVFYNANDPTGTQFRLWTNGDTNVYERIMPGAFSNVDQDVVALFNHDPNLVLGRYSPSPGRKNNTLKLWQDSTGLKYEITPGSTDLHRNLQEMIARGDVTGSSFAFQPVKQEWKKEANNTHVREIHSVKLIDVSPVTFPAYSAADTSLRSTELRSVKDSYENWLAFVQTQERIARLKTIIK